MTKTLLISAGVAELRIAVVEDNRLQELWLESTIGPDGAQTGALSLVGAVVLGRVERVMAATDAAFVDIGAERAGFLGARDARGLAPSSTDGRVEIASLVHEGEAVLVQVTKDAIGTKGATLTAQIALPGRLLVLTPNDRRIVVSRRIEDEAERARLTAITAEIAASGSAAKGAGYILRTNAAGASAGALKDDAHHLAELWRDISARRKAASAPVILHRDLGPIARALRDHVDEATARILIDDRAAMEDAAAYCRDMLPQAGAKLELYRDAAPLFEAYGIADDIARLAEPRVDFASGGWLMIEATEALTAIDVNSGRHIAGADLEQTALAVDCEAAEEIARQLRLRGIGGFIVIDFIALKEARHRERVAEALRAALAKDRVPAQVLAMSEFGSIELTRKRVRESAMAAATEPCPCCAGRGRRQTAAAIALGALRLAERSARAAPGRAVRVSAAPEIAAWFAEHDAAVREGLARIGLSRFTVTAEGARGRDDVAVETES